MMCVLITQGQPATAKYSILNSESDQVFGRGHLLRAHPSCSYVQSVVCVLANQPVQLFSAA